MRCYLNGMERLQEIADFDCPSFKAAKVTPRAHMRITENWCFLEA